MSTPPLQAQLFAALASILGESINLAQWLQDEIGFSKNQAYRSLNGQRSLTLEESFQIMQVQPEIYLKINQNLDFKDRIMIKVTHFSCEDSFQSYLQTIIKVFSKAVAAESSRLFYTARDLPIFYFLARPRLLEYKYAYWQGQSRDRGIIPLSALTHNLAQKVYQLYLQIPSQEIWHPYAYKQQVRLLKGSLKEGSIDASLAEKVQTDLDWLTAQLRDHLLTHQKSESAPLEIFDLAEHSMDNCGILEFDGRQILMSAQPIARFFSSENPCLIDTYLSAFRDHRRRARGISAEGKQVWEEWFRSITGSHEGRKKI